jgi:hypothetical protein
MGRLDQGTIAQLGQRGQRHSDKTRRIEPSQIRGEANQGKGQDGPLR